jgi:membrane protein implicated in regulation of membrane protease activity
MQGGLGSIHKSPCCWFVGMCLNCVRLAMLGLLGLLWLHSSLVAVDASTVKSKLFFPISLHLLTFFICLVVLLARRPFSTTCTRSH